MRILMINKFLYPNGGSETYMLKLGEELERRGNEVQYFGMEHEGRTVGNRAESYTSPVDFHSGGLRIVTYPFRIIYSEEARKKLRTVLLDFRPEVIHLGNINFQLTPSVIEEARDFEAAHPEIYGEKPLRIISTAHDFQWICPNHMLRVPSTGKLCTECIDGDFSQCAKQRCIHNSGLRSTLGTIEGRFYKKRKTYEKVDLVICPSIFLMTMMQHSEELYTRLVMLHNFYEPAGSGSKTDTSGEEKQAEIRENRGSYVLYMGRFSEEKGIRTLMEAVRALPDIPFAFAGSGPLEKEIEGSNVKKLGFLSGNDLDRAVRGARFLVLTSEWYENCPMTILEAQSRGVPVLCSDLGGAPELIETRGDKATGRLFRGGDPEDLTLAVRELWDDPERTDRMSAACTPFVRDNFDTLEEYTDKLLELYTGKTCERGQEMVN